jgi:hypothetical protein
MHLECTDIRLRYFLHNKSLGSDRVVKNLSMKRHISLQLQYRFDARKPIATRKGTSTIGIATLSQSNDDCCEFTGDAAGAFVVAVMTCWSQASDVSVPTAGKLDPGGQYSFTVHDRFSPPGDVL